MDYQLNDLVPTSDSSIVYVVGKNYYFISYGYGNQPTTWKELLDKSVMNKKEKYGSCLIIIEEPLNGKAYQFGNYDRKVVYEHGSTKGYA